MNCSFYKLVYDYYESRILYGFYRYGDKLPSISNICEIFNMAPATIRSALALLEKRGYICMEARKVARVIYQADPGQFRTNAAQYFVPRKEGILDLFDSGKLLFEPVWEKGLRKWSQEDWEVLREDLIHPKANMVSMPVQFYILCLNTFHNGLLLNLYWETIRYIRFPYLADEKESLLAARMLQGQSKEEIIAFLKGGFEEAFQDSVGELFSFIEQSRVQYHLEDARQQPFLWNIYRQRPQLRYTLVSKIIRKIIVGKYPKGTCLPSLPVMAMEYGVSLNTIRRGLDILNGLGVVRSYQGKGTFVCMEFSEMDYDKPEIQEGLCLYEESLEIMALTIRQVLLYTLERVTKEERKALAEELAALCQEKKSYLGFQVILTFIEEKCPLHIVKEAYRGMQGLLDWGYPFILRRLKDNSLQREYRDSIARARDHICSSQLDEFANDWKEIMEKEHEKVSRLLAEIKKGSFQREEKDIP